MRGSMMIEVEKIKKLICECDFNIEVINKQHINILKLLKEIDEIQHTKISCDCVIKSTDVPNMGLIYYRRECPVHGNLFKI